MTTALQRRQTLLPPVSPAERAAARGARITPDYRLDELKLDPEDKTLSSVAIAPVLTDGTLTLTIVGASTIEIDLADHDKTLLTGNFLTRWLWGENADHRDDAAWILHGRKILVQLDDLTFRLRRLQKNETRILTLEVEDIVASDLRATAGPKVATRGTAAGGGITRAQFVQSMCKEAGVASYIPELTDPQPIQATSATPTASQRKQRGQMGLDRSAHLTAKGAALKPEQLRNANTILDVGTSLRASNKVLISAIVCSINESDLINVHHGDAAGPDSTGLFQQRNSWGPRKTRQDPAGAARLYFQAAIKVDRHNPSATIPELITMVQFPAASSPAAAHSFAGGQVVGWEQRWVREGTAIANAYKPGISNTGTTSITVEKAFQFTRGKQENSWDAIQRLAQEVQWRAFVRRHPITGQQALWYVSDQFLSEQVPAMTVWEHRPDRPSAVEAITHTVDLGARNAAADLAITARVGRWTALPGMRVIVYEEGPADGGWLVQDVTRPLWDPVASITCTKPIPSLAEPAPQTQTLTVGTAQFGVVSAGALGKAQRFYDECKTISDAGGPYVWGGGHSGSLAHQNPRAGLDCSGSVCLALYRAGLFQGRTTCIVSGQFGSWGQAGKGKFFTVWYNGVHVFVELSVPGRSGKRYDTSPHGSGGRGPRIRNSHRSHAGFSPRHFPGL